MHAEKNYTSQLGAGLGMISETMDLLRLWEPGLSPSQLADRAVEAGLFSRATARRARNLALEMFAPRYLTNEGLTASRIKILLEHRFPYEGLVQLFFLQTARAQQIFADFVLEVYWPKYSAGALFLNKEDASRFIQKACDSGLIAKRWSESVVDNVAGYLIGCCVDFGLLGKGKRTERPIKRFSIRNDVALYLAHELHFAGLSDMALIQHRDWRLFGLEGQEIVGLLKTLSHDGHLLIQSSADLVQISWKYRTMEDCLGVLAQR
jgi:Putative inner membrane protein (DUF1819)